jgi:hypothetical protein
MNVDTGELIRMGLMDAKEQLKTVKKGFTPVPQELEEEAMRELGEKDQTIVDLKKKPATPLTEWANKTAASKRNTKKVRRHISNDSKRRNRR